MVDMTACNTAKFTKNLIAFITRWKKNVKQKTSFEKSRSKCCKVVSIMSSLNEPLLNLDEQLTSHNIDSVVNSTTCDAGSGNEQNIYDDPEQVRSFLEQYFIELSSICVCSRVQVSNVCG